MGSYIIRRLVYMMFTLVLVSVVGFIIITAPPGDYITYYLEALKSSGVLGDYGDEQAEAFRKIYGLDKPLYVQYIRWMGRLLRGDLGYSFQWNRPVAKIIGERLPNTVMISLLTLLFTYAVAIPIGIYSATHQYSFGDYSATVVGFVGLAIPNFMLALILMWFFYSVFDFPITGLFSSEFLDAPWSLRKFLDMIAHLPIVIIVVGTAGTAGLIRVMRACLLDELQKQYVITARAKGVGENSMLFKYPVRVAINPIISTVGWTLPAIVSGTIITAIVLNLPTVGPLLYSALTMEDMNVASSLVMILSALTIIGTFLSDILLVWVDPRIRYEKEMGR